MSSIVHTVKIKDADVEGGFRIVNASDYTPEELAKLKIYKEPVVKDADQANQDETNPDADAAKTE